MVENMRSPAEVLETGVLAQRLDPQRREQIERMNVTEEIYRVLLEHRRFPDQSTAPNMSNW
jgi:hypothetical protein